MRRIWPVWAVVCGLLPGLAAAEWQVSTECRGVFTRADDLTHAETVQAWGVDTVTGASARREARVGAADLRVTAAYVDAGVSRLVGLRYVGGWDQALPYSHLRLSNLIVAWRGADGSLEGGTVLTPTSWGRGLLVDDLHFSGGRARVVWGTSGRTEGFWTDTVDDPARARYYEQATAGVIHTAEFPGGSAGIEILDTRRNQTAVFPKQGFARGTFAGLTCVYRPLDGWSLDGEGAWGWLRESESERTWAGSVGSRWTFAPEVRLDLDGRYQGRGFNPACGGFNRDDLESGEALVGLPWTLAGGALRLRPGWGWKQQRAGNFWVPSFELEWSWTDGGLGLRLQESAEQPWDRWGAVDHWEYTRAALTWRAAASLRAAVRWEKIFDGFTRSKHQNLVAELELTY